jgi:transposase
MDAIFWVACTVEPWRCLPEAFGSGQTAARHFRRLDDAGVWDRLLEAIAYGGGSPEREAVVRALRTRVCRACRRAL